MMRWLASAPSSAVCPSAPASLLPLASLTHHTHTCPLPLPLSPSFHSPLTCGEIICLVSRPSGGDAGSEPATAPDRGRGGRPRARDDTRHRRPLVPPSAVASVAHFPVLIALQTTNHGERQPRAGSRGCENLCNRQTFLRT